MVVDELENKPPVKPIIVEVELYPLFTVKGNSNDEPEPDGQLLLQLPERQI